MKEPEDGGCIKAVHSVACELLLLESLKSLRSLLGHVWIVAACGLAQVFGGASQVPLRGQHQAQV